LVSDRQHTRVACLFAKHDVYRNENQNERKKLKSRVPRIQKSFKLQMSQFVKKVFRQKKMKRSSKFEKSTELNESEIVHENIDPLHYPPQEQEGNRNWYCDIMHNMSDNPFFENIGMILATLADEQRRITSHHPANVNPKHIVIIFIEGIIG